MGKWRYTRKELIKREKKSHEFWKGYAKKYNSDWGRGAADCSYDNVRELKDSRASGWSRVELADFLNKAVEIFNHPDSWHAGYRTTLRDLRSDLLERKVKNV